MVLNFVYADVLNLFDVVYNGKGSIQFSPALLLGSSVLVEIPMAMVIFSRVLNYRANRLSSIIVAAAYAMVTLITQFILPLSNGTTTGYYLFFGAIEILTTSLIVWYAWKWSKPEVRSRKL